VDDKQSLVGTKLPPCRLTVERGKIRELALAIGDVRDIYVDRDAAARAGYADVAVPPTFGSLVEFWGGPEIKETIESLKLNYDRSLHGEQEYEYLGDIVAGDEITSHTTVTGCVEKENMYLVTLESVFVNQRGEEVLKGRKVIVELK